MFKAVITRTKDRVVEVNGTRVGTAQRAPGMWGSSPSWTLWIDAEFRTNAVKKFECHATAERLREAALAVYCRRQSKRVVEFAEANVPGFAQHR